MTNADLETGKRIQSERERRGWSKSQLSHQSGIQRKRIERIEGGSAMRLKEALAIAKALNMEIKLLAYGEQTKTLSEDDYEAMRRYSAMPAEWRKIANSTINNLYESWRKVTSLVKRS